MRFIAQLQNMGASEIMDMIPASVHERVKGRDPDPVYRAYVVGHEGESTGYLIGIGNVVKKWFKTAISALADKLQFGTKVFHDHAKNTNDHAGRMSIGEIVGKAVKNIKDQMSVVAVAYIYPEYRDLPLDVASIEADIHLDPSGQIEAADVVEVTGLALGNSKVSRPGFANATLLGQLQAFYQSQFTDDGGNDMNLTVDKIKSFIKAESLKPSDIFGVESLAADPAVEGYVESERKKASSGEYAHRKRTDEAFDKARAEWEKEKSGLTEKIKTLSIDAAKSKTGDLVETLLKSRKIEDDKQAEFLRDEVKTNFAPQDPEKMEAELNDFLDKSVENFKRISKLFDAGNGSGKEGGGDSGTGPDAGKGGGSKEDALLDPEQNPFIPKIQ